MVITVRISLVSKAVIMMFPAYIHSHPVAQVISQSRHAFHAVAIIEVTDPASDDLIDSPDYRLSRCCTILFSRQLPDL